jgi:hypothetical protein
MYGIALGHDAGAEDADGVGFQAVGPGQGALQGGELDGGGGIFPGRRLNAVVFVGDELFMPLNGSGQFLEVKSNVAGCCMHWFLWLSPTSLK